MKRARTAALSAGMMLIAGCGGGGHALAPSPSGGNGNSLGSSSGTLTNPGRVTLNITVPARQTQSHRGTSDYKPTSVRRVPSWVSPSTAYVGIQEMYNEQQAYFTYLALSSCTPSSGTYQCTTNLQAGTFAIYTNLYDQNVYLLSTNVYSSPAPTTIYPNGSSYPNNIYITTAGVISNLQEASPSLCFAAGVQQSIPLYVLDADGNTIVGPIANPITPTFTAYDGAGFGAISLYVMYDGSPLAANTGLALTDTSVLSSPYFFVSGQEGAIYAAGTLQNIPVYNNGSLSYTASGGYAATGTYIAWGIDNNPQADGIYPIAVQQTLNRAIMCNSANGTNNAFIEIESFLDPVTGIPYLVTGDAYNNIAIFDAYSTANAAHSYTFFQTSNAYGNIGPKWNLYQTYGFAPSNPWVEILTSSVFTGRVDVISAGAIDIFDTSNGMPSDGFVYTATSGITLTGSTRLSSDPSAGALYFNDPGTPSVYGINTGSGPPGTSYPFIDFSVYPITGQVYSIVTSGNGSALQVARGADSSNNFYICAWSASSFAGSVSCHYTMSADTNPVSLQYDPSTGDIMFATGGTSAYAMPAHNVAPATFISNFPGTAIYTTLAHTAGHILSGLEGVPGVAGFYGGPQASGQCSGTGQVTWLRYSAGSWVYLATMCWPNNYLTLTYP